MKSSESPSHLWWGAAVGVGFRTFAYGVLYSVLSTNSQSSHPLVENVPCRIVIFTSPFWVPFVAGFLSAYFWRDFDPIDYSATIGLTTLAFVVIAASFSLSIHASLVAFEVLLICLDVCLGIGGAKKGTKFWNGQMGRQFLGDFSVRDEE